ncbi:hypothetical protein Dpep_1542 [Dethiosulfovibrio peptidovorans DSM 11002]|uniref:Uncharacterized protein n=1 Tax=Dethiosulfovibrio peptidovorans DSM 11002 TaxID=469381 RepID=D2Z7X1_9BACT|nr:hypothetical protein Dpep_1542 [Dethiosulfovibrio peptidovorans DSM 11002]
MLASLCNRLYNALGCNNFLEVACMWEKDSCGNWYMDGSKVFSTYRSEVSFVWDKDESGRWVRVPSSRGVPVTL